MSAGTVLGLLRRYFVIVVVRDRLTARGIATVEDATFRV